MKKFVLTFTPNPALDLSGEVDQVIPNEKNYVHKEKRNPGGNAINVARVLTRLGTSAIASGFLGGSTGRELVQLLKAEKVPTDFIPIAENTRINITVQNLKTHDQTRLSFPGPKISAQEESCALQYLDRKQKQISLAVIGGSFPENYSFLDANQWIRQCVGFNIPVVVDVPGKYLKKLRHEKMFFIKPNFTEWVQATGFRSLKKENLLQKVIDFTRNYFKHTEWICISSFGGGALLIGRERVYHALLPKLTVRSTVGAGDSMVAGWIHGVSAQYTPVDCLRIAMACAGATLQTRGTALADAKEVRRLFSKIKVFEVQ
jgi:1-phosphofructokinase family hexose kinase